MTYATIEEVRARYLGEAGDDLVNSLLEESAVLIDAYNNRAKSSVKKVVALRMVVRALGSATDASIPMGASQGTVSALGYSQTWTLSAGGSTGELYLTKSEKRMLGYGDQIGASSPLGGRSCEE